VLDVPDDRIVEFIDDRVWNMILGNKIWYPEKHRQPWHQEMPDTECARYLRRMEHEYDNRPAPNGDWWSVLFRERNNLQLDDSDELTSAFLFHPVEKQWVVSVGGNKL
jgi:hypothetical protein